MDARKIKKAILVFALDKAISSDFDEIAIAVFDKNSDDLTDAEIRRFERVSEKMYDDALAKLD